MWKRGLGLLSLFFLLFRQVIIAHKVAFLSEFSRLVVHNQLNSVVEVPNTRKGTSGPNTLQVLESQY